MAECPNCSFPVGPKEKFCGRCGAQLDTAGSEPLLGAIIADRYRIHSRVGEGTLGTVYRCEHVRMGKTMSIKVLRPELSRDPMLVQRFKLEAREVSQLGNPHTVTLLDFGTHEGSIYIVTEYLYGVDLGTLLAEVGLLSFPRAVNMIVQACESLAEAHQREILHLDLKPENLFLSRTRNGEDFIKVLDYGLVKLVDQSIGEPLSGHLMSSPHYLSPEQIRGEEPDARSDIYSLGATLYRMVTGSPPYSARTALGVLQQHLEAEVPDPCALAELHLHDEVRRVLQRALAKQPEQRHPTMDAFRSDLLAAVDRIKANDLLMKLGSRTPLPSVFGSSDAHGGAGRVASPEAAVGEQRTEPGPSAAAPEPARSGPAPEDGAPPAVGAGGQPPLARKWPTSGTSPALDTRHEQEVPGELLGTRQDIERFETQMIARAAWFRMMSLAGLVLVLVLAGVLFWLLRRG